MRRDHLQNHAVKGMGKSKAVSLTLLKIAGFALLMTLLLLAQSVNAKSTAVEYMNSDEGMAKLSDIGQRFTHAQLELQSAIDAFKEGDYYQAERILLPLAESDYKEAQYLLGVLYDSASEDRIKAINWYSQAAENGHSDAQHNLGLAYARGQGTVRNIHMALKWWHAAAEKGNSDSQYNLGIIYATGAQGIKQDFKEAKKWWQMAASGGDALAQYNLGALFASGVDGELNLCKAAHWWNLSQENGFSQANQALENLGQVMDVAMCH